MHVKPVSIILLSCLLFSCRQNISYTEWQIYRGGRESNCYSSIKQIDTTNVDKLRVAWTFHTGDSGVAIQCNPIIVEDVMYVSSPGLKIIALHAASGKLKWIFDPINKGKSDGVNRGVTYWEKGNDKRILFAVGYTLYALNAETGKLITGFGKDGSLDMREGLDRPANGLFVEITSPGIIFQDLIIMGSRVSEGEGAAPGHVRAFNVVTGKQTWTFHTIPQPGEYGYDTWEANTWKTIGGANSWSGFSLDEKRGLVFFATGSCAPDFYGGDRKGQNLFANSVIALDAKTGKRSWHYQLVHHDLWDYDLPTPPNLVTLGINGKQTDAVAQATKTGHIFILDRETGKPIFNVEERKVPVSDIEGEASWPTQPYPTKPLPFVRQQYTADDISDVSTKSTNYIKERLKTVRNEGIFTPSSANGSLIFPGFRGGAEWNGGSFDPETGMYYINANEIPNISGLTKIAGGAAGETGENLFRLHCATCHGFDKKGAKTFPSLVNLGMKLTAAQLTERIKKGKGQMPAFPHLKQEQVSNVVTYLLQKGSSPKNLTAVINNKENTATGFKYAHTGYGQFLDEEGYPAVKPPWGTLSAINLNTGEMHWKIPLGEYPELIKKGIPVTGTQNFGGTMVTAGGLVFVGATKDEKFRAFTKSTGKLLWETTLPAGGYATPSTYEINGKQYVVIAAGGGGKNNTKKGDAYVAFALPE